MTEEVKTQELTEAQEKLISDKVVATLEEMFDNPLNRLSFASRILTTALESINDKAKSLKNKESKPVVAQVYYKGAIKGTIITSEETETKIDVKLEVEECDEDGELIKDSWTTELKDTSEEQANIIKKFFLSNSNLIPGDVRFLTTNTAIDEELDSVAEKLVEQLDKEVK